LWQLARVRAQGQWKSACGPVGQMSTRVGITGGVGVEPSNPSSCLHTLIFEAFDPWAKFQTFRHLSVLQVSIIIICKLLSSHLDKCIVTLGHFSTTSISTGGGQLEARTRAQGQAAPLWRRPCFEGVVLNDSKM